MINTANIKSDFTTFSLITCSKELAEKLHQKMHILMNYLKYIQFLNFNLKIHHNYIIWVTQFFPSLQNFYIANKGHSCKKNYSTY